VTTANRDLPLPIDAVLPALTAALDRGHAVLTAPTGSGKTTRVPLALRDAHWLGGRSIWMLEPRRPAARLAAARMAALLRESVGEQVGCQVRFERRIGPRTRIQVLTEGILTRRVQQDPELAGCGLLIFDEFHERGLDADLALALALDLAGALRDDLRILVMSATLDVAPIAALLGGAPAIEGAGRTFPVEVSHAERRVADPLPLVPAAVRQLLAEQPGDILVFLPGAAEIDRCAAALADLSDPAGIEVLPLHGNLSLSEQDRALRPPRASQRPRRIVLATDIAETSVTIHGIGAVVDTGLTRKPRFDPATGLTRLVTEPVPLASADQRAGRAGRLGPGRCLRLWTPEQAIGRPAQRPAEILQADLAGLVLELALWGVTDPAALAWLDPPPAPAWAQARTLLVALGAVDAQGAITEAGRQMARLPAHPRLAHMLTAAPARARALAADLAALISERDAWIVNRDLPRPADLGLRLLALQAHRKGGATPGWEPRRLAAIDRAAGQFRQLVDGPAAKRDADVGTDTAGRLLALAYPDRVAQHRGDGEGRYRLASGTGAALPRDDPLIGTPWLVVAELAAASGDHRIRSALAIEADTLQEVMAGRIQTRRALRWDAEREAVAARDEIRLGALLLGDHPAPVAHSAEVRSLLLLAVVRDPERALNWSDTARQLQARVALVRTRCPGSGGDGRWPDLSDDGLMAHLDGWLGPWLEGKTRLADVRALDLAECLVALLGWERRRRLDQLTPEAIVTPAGNRRRIDYRPEGGPVVALPLQEMFGAVGTPSVCNGRVPVLLHLLSPAGRPLAVTADLAGFWAGAYADVRKQMRGRYPKHHWPEDPSTAAALVGGVKRRR
jgi:ATP-dependent helicase HrpB